VFDNYSSPGSTTGLNVSYVNLGSYDGSDASTAVIVLPLAERLTARAPVDLALRFAIPTDIVWNEYEADPNAWLIAAQNASGQCQLSTIWVVPYINNTDPPIGGGPPRARTDTLRIRFLSSDRQVLHAGFDLVYTSAPNYYAYFSEQINLALMDPPLLIPRAGYMLLDWAEPQVSGVGSVFAGGDLIHPDFPRPESLRTLGFTDVETMSWADGQLGIGGYPNLLDPGYDGDPASTSYIDIVNTGAVANWHFRIGDPPTRMLCRDFPVRIAVATEDDPCACDFNNSGFVNSQDFFDFISMFFVGDADFNQSGFTDSQDFFDFLVCFFGGC